MKTIVVAYWSSFFDDEIGIKNNTPFDYSDEKKHEIIDLILSKGYNVMLYQNEPRLIIWIDDKRFQQR